ncbi:hypothetical protein KGF56_000370 [Candida oxycetoniae]|uniref:Succinate dehydrogenase assembly factor 4, mitochondrial n=1 Tax=Candida oxycetoniae TaxID=497107 RepID=A0AAI9T272_9ASCO|nr:uncharacterized protein KGF56_000370 [Candida oxycetoniae]KAI3406765.2 hypothetical protein KGF56_000370 [Candida oxycetoniae]
MLSNLLKRSTVGVSVYRNKQIFPKSAFSFRCYSPPSKKFGQSYQGPPKLPKEEQEEFERLQNIAQSQIAIEEYNDSVKAGQAAEGEVFAGKETPPVVAVDANSDIGSFAYLKTIPEFEGDVNPVTGEKGGPKQDPLKTGDEWTFNGRTIDF